MTETFNPSVEVYESVQQHLSSLWISPQILIDLTHIHNFTPTLRTGGHQMCQERRQPRDNVADPFRQ